MDRNISPKTKFAEGALNGTRFAIVHSLILAPYLSRELSLESGRSFRMEYLKHCLRAFTMYAGVLGLTFGMRQLVYQNKDRILFDI